MHLKNTEVDILFRKRLIITVYLNESNLNFYEHVMFCKLCVNT